MDRQPFGIDDAEAYPLFTDDLIELMRELVPVERHDRIATTITLTAHKPAPAGQSLEGSSSSGG